MSAPSASLRPGGARRAFRQLLRSPVGMIGAFMVVSVVVVALFAPWIAPHDPAQHNRRDRFRPPVWMEGGGPDHVLGTDQLGRDIMSRLIHGSRISVAVGVSSVLIGGILGALLGLLAGLYGGRVDTIVSRGIDTFMALPFLILVLAVIGILGPSLLTIILVLGFTGWATYARVVRGETLAMRERDFVGAAQALGANRWRVASKHVLPNISASIIVLATLDVAATILAESSLSFLGLGVQPPAVTWGLMISSGREYLSSAWWLAVFPGLCISYAVLGVIFLGDFLRDVLDPKIDT
ncbi:MAG: ABC transporter permease [bacterium]|nr:ABC transporter permease [bacterium]